MTTFILSAPHPAGRLRATLSTNDSIDVRLDSLAMIIDKAGLRQLATPHQMHAIAGPDHPHHQAAIDAYGMLSAPPCDAKIVTRTLELLVASDLLDPGMINDPLLAGLLASAFAFESDWEERTKSSEAVAALFLAERYTGFEKPTYELDPQRLAAVIALSGGIAVAVTAARVEQAA